MDWATICTRLRHDPNDQAAWDSLDARVRSWAYDRLRDLEAGLISWALKASKGNKSKAAELLQIKRSTLGDRINRCGLGRGDESSRAPQTRSSPEAAAP